MYHFKSIAILAFITMMACTELFAQNWDLAKNKNGVKVYTRKVDGYKLKEYKGEAIIKVSANKVLGLLTNVNAYTKWMPDCTQSKLLRKVSETELYQYTVTDAPWPVTDRDNIALMTIKRQSSGAIRLDLEGKPDYMDKNDKYVRVPQLTASWELIPQGDGSTKVVYQGLASPGGSIPDWLANSFVVDTPFNTLVNMREYLTD